MRNFTKCFFLLSVLWLSLSVNAQAAEKVSDFDKNRISILLNDVIAGRMSTVSESTFDASKPSALLNFAANFVSKSLTYSTMTSLTTKDLGQYQGNGVIPLQAVKDVAKRFFDYEMPTPAEGDYDDMQFKGGHFYIVMADGGLYENILLTEVKVNKDNTITAHGKIFDVEEGVGEGQKLDTFTALLKPHVWKGMKTYAIISISRQKSE